MHSITYPCQNVQLIYVGKRGPKSLSKIEKFIENWYDHILIEWNE